ncbi:hypothetical protein ACOMHN_000765 [Nucella lapillus]
MGLQDYLAFCVQALERLQEFHAVHVVIGNESCDLDSAVSAIVYAYFLHETSLASVGTALFLPLLNIPRSDFPLRTEIVHFLGKFGISAPDLIFQDDLDLAKVKVTTDLKVTLVDHHVLSGTKMAELEESVVQILDHRPKDGELPDSLHTLGQQCKGYLPHSFHTLGQQCKGYPPHSLHTLGQQCKGYPPHSLNTLGQQCKGYLPHSFHTLGQQCKGYPSHSLHTLGQQCKGYPPHSLNTLGQQCKGYPPHSLNTLGKQCKGYPPHSLNTLGQQCKGYPPHSLNTLGQQCKGYPPHSLNTLGQQCKGYPPHSLHALGQQCKGYPPHSLNTLGQQCKGYPPHSLNTLGQQCKGYPPHSLNTLGQQCESTLELVGSCSTLVAEALLAEETFTMDPVCATLLYGTIVTDTINFSPAASKTTAKDLDIAERLEEVTEGGLDRDAIFEEIKTAKFDLSGLSSTEVLIKDLKMVSGDSLMVAMSSVTMDMTALMERSDFEVSLKTFAQDRKVDAVVILTICSRRHDDITRQLGVFSPSRVYRQQMADVLNASQSPNLGLSPLPCNLEEFLPFSQGNVTASRKQILPVIKSFLAGESTPDETQADAYDIPKDQSEGFTSMSSIVGSRQNTSEGDISSEDLISRDDSTEEDLLHSESLLPSEELLPSDQRVFDPLSSVHSSDSGATSPLPLAGDGNLNAVSSEQWLPSSDEIVPGQEEVLLHEDSNSGDAEGGGDESEAGRKSVEGEGEEEEEEEGGGVRDSAVSMSGGDGGSDLISSSTTTTQDLPLTSTSFPLPPTPLLNTSSPSPPPPSSQDDGVNEGVNNNPAGFNHHHNNNNADPARHNGLAPQGGGEATLQQDFLDMTSHHDLLFPADSPLDGASAATSGQVSGQVSGQTSGQTSGLTSKVPSYPVTPPNSYMDEGVMNKEVELPSFNSSEMVEKIQEKKAALGPSGSEDTDLTPLSPFTPQNSYVDNAFAKETHLPSFHSSDMVERIRVKRSSMERDAQGMGAQEDALLDVATNPFTPHNSFVEGSFDKFARETLPSLNNAEIANRIRQKQAELSAAAGGGGGGWGGDSGTESPMGVEDNSTCSPAAPYTPQNSYRDSHLDSLHFDSSHVTDLNEVAERLSLTGSESSGSLNEPKSVKVSNRVHMQGLSPQEASHGFAEMSASSEASSMVSSGTDPQIAMDTTSASMGVKRKGVSFSQQNEDSGSAVGEEAIQKIAYELANEMIQKALETFPSESVKELVPSGASGGGGRERILHPSVSEDSSPTMDESDQELSSGFSPGFDAHDAAGTPDSALASSTESEQLNAAHFSQPAESAMKMSSSLADELAQAMRSGGGGGGEHSREVSSSSPEEGQGLSATGGASGVPKSQSYEIETEYLCDMDPMQKMGAFHPDASVIETDADKEVVEGESFRKISGQEYQGVQEGILQEIRQEAKAREMNQLLRSSVAKDDDNEAGIHSPVADDDKNRPLQSDDKKKITLEEELNLDDSLTDEQGKKTLHTARDRELYASALENERAVIDVPEQQTLKPSDASHPLLEPAPTSSEAEAEKTHDLGKAEDHAKRKIHAEDSGKGGDHCYESFAERESADAERMLVSERSKSSRAGSMARTVSGASETSLKGVELCDEWQDDEMPKMLGAEAQAMADDSDPLNAAGSEVNRKRVVPEQGLVEEREGDNLENVEVVDSDSEIDSDMDNEQLEWETRKLLRDDTPVQTPPTKRVVEEAEEIPQYTAAEERRDAQNWKIVTMGEGGDDFRLDMRVIEPYKRVLSHGGYCGEGLTAMIVFSACYLPSRDRRDYSYVMNHLFHYVLHTLDELVADDYMIVYFHGATPRRQMPSFSWLKRCYQGIDRRLRKNLQALFLVHPTLWLKTVVLMTRPFISAKFSSKLQFVRTLSDLKQLIPMEYVYIPDIVQRYDDRHFHPPPHSSSSSTAAAPQ